MPFLLAVLKWYDMNENIKEAHELLYQAQLRLTKLLEENPLFPSEIEYWCRALQDLMDEMREIGRLEKTNINS